MAGRAFQRPNAPSMPKSSYIGLVRILIAGASGFIGRDLARRLADHGHGVIAASRRDPAPMDGVTTLTLDVADEQALVKQLRGVDSAYYLLHTLDAGDSFYRVDLVTPVDRPRQSRLDREPIHPRGQYRTESAPTPRSTIEPLSLASSRMNRTTLRR